MSKFSWKDLPKREELSGAKVDKIWLDEYSTFPEKRVREEVKWTDPDYFAGEAADREYFSAITASFKDQRRPRTPTYVSKHPDWGSW